MIDSQVLERHGLKPDEYERIVQFLGREPNLTELGIFSVMWSEHCSYKSSRVHLKKLPTRGPRVLQGHGENADHFAPPQDTWELNSNGTLESAIISALETHFQSLH